MTRLLRIALREYLAYVRTFGFWLSLALLPVGLSTIIVAPVAVARSAPTPAVAIVDLTTQGLRAEVAQAMLTHGDGGKPAGILVEAPGAPFASAADAAQRLKPYLTGGRTLPAGGHLDDVAILSPADDTVTVDFWSRNVGDQRIQGVVTDTVRDAVRRHRLEKHGIDAKLLSSIDSTQPHVAVFSPKAETGRVSFRDRLPGFAGFGMGLLLWMVVMTGAGMLLNSVMEEKSSRILEVLLTSASVPEIMAGKIIGVAAVTATILLFWMTIAGTVLTLRSPALAADVGSILVSHGRWAYFALYFLGGYLMFATLYVTIGAFCETAREAQTLLGPMMIVMTIPVMVMSQGIIHPDAPILHTLTWIPLFTPFMMAARVAGDPPAWEVVATGALMIGVTALELWVAIPAFKTGALSSGRFNIRLFMTSLVRRSMP
jgi:ABC-2 type transport system permease protein